MAKRLILALMVVCIAAVVRVTEGDCGKAPQLENGAPTDAFISDNTFSVGTRLQYNCNPGYKLQQGASPFITCKDDSTWTPLRAVCEPRNCGNPGDLPNGYFEAADTTFGTKAFFFCDEGYRMVGQNYRLCVADGWNGQVPTCDAVVCADPPSIPNGKVSTLPPAMNWDYGMVATYSCIGDYSLIGGNDLSCTATGQWDKDPPKCKVVECQRPTTEVSANIEIVSGFAHMYKYRDTITYRCSNGRDEMVGNSVIECSENNIFVPQPPTCKLRATTTITFSTAVPVTAATSAGTAATTTAAKIPPTAPPTYNTVKTVGIIVGVLLGVIVVLIVVFFIWRYLKRKGQYVTSEKVAMNPQSEQAQERPNCDETSNCPA